ncbi:hypothetical protein PHMEG_00027540 [Phytophthora megakarya]|uniref:Bzip transcription factor n=1 Tax=Phytophthora megakarya TaxID=4795 RepID=A0A225V8M2_9STRA|nr:hypothetical protein PHMEG_00027540 [Phytophthora megakarya]
MNTLLQPPNNQYLSENVIGGVALRANQAERFNQTSHFDRRRCLPPKSPIRTSNPRKVPSDAIVNQLLFEQSRLRELRRMRQIRYRKKKDDYANRLEEENRQMQVEINTLQQRQRSLTSAIPTTESVWSVATEYFRLFRFGIQASSATSHSDTPTQVEFVRKTMTPDVVFNASYGPEAILKSWKCLSLCFDDVEAELEELKKSGESMIATTTTKVTITERTLRNVFPHLVNERCELAMKLLNQRLEVRGSVRFAWDPVYCRVSGVLSQSDLLTPLLRLLGSLEDTSRVLEKALISPNFQWKSRTA